MWRYQVGMLQAMVMWLSYLIGALYEAIIKQWLLGSK
jgi:hypothetical protein